MRLVVACDHRGFEAKQRLLASLKAQKYDPADLGCNSTAPVDYPDIALRVARAIQSGHADVGILLDKSGVGMSIAANKVRGVRAALAHDEVTARVARAHNHCNVLCMGVDLLTDDQMRKIVEIFLTTPFEGGRHQRRVAKVDEIMG
ncbi:MAG: ribose 5-phosphate isomerase B [Tepidisphaerales bacterium]